MEQVQEKRQEDSTVAFLGLTGVTQSLGDARLDKRMKHIAQSSLSARDSSLREVGGETDAEYQATARFLKNERVELSDLRKVLYEVSVKNVQRQGLDEVVVAYDPTYLNYGKIKNKENLKAHRKGQRVYTWLNSALVEPGTGRLLGLGHQTLVSDKGPDDAEWLQELETLPKGLREEYETNPKLWFALHCQAVARRCPKTLKMIHVADSEFDDASAFRHIAKLGENHHFVIRADGQRVVAVPKSLGLAPPSKEPSSQKRLESADDPETQDYVLSELPQRLDYRPAYSILLNGRGRIVQKKSKAVRKADLSMACIPVQLVRKSTRGERHKLDEKAIWMRLLVIKELAPPPGAKPICWMLLTDLDPQGDEECIEIIDYYLARWRIESFFRTTKGEFKVEDSRVHKETTTARLLFFVTLKALFLDSLRQLAGIRAGTPPTTPQRQAMRKAAEQALQAEKNFWRHRILPPSLTPQQRGLTIIGLLARWGCWISKSGQSLGNRVLSKGLPRLLGAFEEGRMLWILDEKLFEKSVLREVMG